MRYVSTERIGINAIERIILEELNWIFREQPIADVGIDAIIEVVKDNNPIGKFIAIQIKSGQGNFHSNEKSLIYYTSDIHYNYWTNCNLPVILIGYIPEESSAYWIPLKPDNFIRTKRQWKIELPRKQKLGANSEKRLLNLVNVDSPIEIDEKWSIEKIEKLNEEVKNISRSALSIDELRKHLSNLRLEQDKANEKFTILIDKGLNIESYQTKIVIKELVNSMRIIVPLMEDEINKFSQLFATGIEAFQELIKGCKELNLENVLLDTLPAISILPPTAKKSIEQVEGLKNTLDKFSTKDQQWKQSNNALSEILNLVIREFKVSSDLTENIIKIITD